MLISTPLPIPDLEDTIRQYLEALEPITDAESFRESKKIAYDFAAEEGRKLQCKLIEYANELGGGSWLKEYSRERFLTTRKPLSIAANYCMEFESPLWLSKYTQSAAAALLAYSVGKLYQDMACDRLAPPQRSSSSLCKEQLSLTLGAARHPKNTADSYEVYTPFNQAHSFGMFYQNHYYLIRLFDDKGNLVSYNSIYSAISQVLMKQQPSLEVNFNTMGFAGSEKCASLLDNIIIDDHNRACYDKVCRSIFHMSLDNKPRSAYSINNILYSNTENQWPYKPWTFTIFADNSIAVNNEHTAIDGVSNVYLYEKVFQYMEQFSSIAWNIGGAAETEHIQFRFTGKQISEMYEIKKWYLEQIDTLYCDEFQRADIDWFLFKEYGIGRDALIQLGFIYAQYRLFGCFKSTHESVSTAQYHQGRTSCLRTVTPEAVEVVPKMLTNDSCAQALITMIKRASKKHSLNIKKAKQNICFIRHSAGLLEMYRLYGKDLGISCMPVIFQDDNYKLFCTQELSTSTIGGSEIIKAFAFAPTAQGGLGLGYHIRDAQLHIVITWDGNQLPEGNKFSEYLNQYYDKLKALSTSLIDRHPED